MTNYPQRQQSLVQAVALDMDGLLLNTEDIYETVMQELVRRRNKAYDEEARRRMIGLPAEQAFNVLIDSHGLDESWQELKVETESIFEALIETELNLMHGVHELFEALDKLSLPRCVATSSNRLFAIRALKHVKLFDRIDFLLTAQDVERGKPHPDIYHEASRRMQVPIANMLVLEDSEIGTRAGVSSGAYVISVLNRHTEHGKFDGAKAIVRSLRDSTIHELIAS